MARKRIRHNGDIKTYSELIKLETYDERFKYLMLRGSVGEDTFGFDRYINQKLYTSPHWRRVRDIVVSRDEACDLGVDGHDIFGRVYVHHMNPIDVDDILNVSDYLFDPEFLISVKHSTHNAIHYGNEGYLDRNKIVTRTANDTSPWKKTIRR